VGHAPVRALRVNFVGELGWELHHPIEYQVGLYQALMDAGRDLGLADFGLRAMDALRLEKGYRVWGADINTEVTPLEAGLERFVAFDKGEFLGRATLLAQRRDGVRKRLATLAVDALDADCHGNEAVLVPASDRVAGITTSGGYAHWLGRSLAVAYLDADQAAVGARLDVEVLGERRPAVVLPEPAFDPENHRPRS
jgi:dimethylglycine dehydrogenase